MGIEEDGFVQIMSQLDLSYPRRIHEALPANLACGLKGDKDAYDSPKRIEEIHVFQLDDASFDRIIDVRSQDEFYGQARPLTHCSLNTTRNVVRGQ